MTVPARRRKMVARSHMRWAMPRMMGARYGGSSRRSMGVSLLSSVFLNTHAMTNAAMSPSAYMPSMMPARWSAPAAGSMTAIITI